MKRVPLSLYSSRSSRLRVSPSLSVQTASREAAKPAKSIRKERKDSANQTSSLRSQDWARMVMTPRSPDPAVNHSGAYGAEPASRKVSAGRPDPSAWPPLPLLERLGPQAELAAEKRLDHHSA
jgi:hypothetical protein